MRNQEKQTFWNQRNTCHLYNLHRRIHCYPIAERQPWHRHVQCRHRPPVLESLPQRLSVVCLHSLNLLAHSLSLSPSLQIYDIYIYYIHDMIICVIELLTSLVVQHKHLSYDVVAIMLPHDSSHQVHAKPYSSLHSSRDILESICWYDGDIFSIWNPDSSISLAKTKSQKALNPKSSFIPLISACFNHPLSGHLKWLYAISLTGWLPIGCKGFQLEMAKASWLLHCKNKVKDAEGFLNIYKKSHQFLLFEGILFASIP